MKTFPLPLGDFESDTPTKLQTVLETTDNNRRGFILECDLEYSDNLHDDHKDFPLASLLLSVYQLETLHDINLKGNFNVEKPSQTLYNKDRYTFHYITLKLYILLALKVKKFHRCLKCRQSEWFSPYIDLNADICQRAANKFEEKIFKLMSNCAYVKCCESKRNLQSISLVRIVKELWRSTENFNIKTVIIFSDELVAVTKRKHKIFWNKPTIVEQQFWICRNCFCLTSITTP